MTLRDDSSDIQHSHYDTIIVGGGVIGLSIGWRLARSGLRVMLVERREVGTGASQAAGAMLAPEAAPRQLDEDIMRFQQESLHRYPDFVSRLEETTELDTGYEVDGTLFVALYPDEVEGLEELRDHQERLGLDAEIIEGAAARQLQPRLARAEAALHVRSYRRVDPDRLLNALLTAYLLEGGELHEETAVRRVALERDSATGVILGDGEFVGADHVVVAAGAWSRTIGGIPEFRRSSLRGERAASLALTNGPEPVCDGVIRTGDIFMVPREETLIVGSINGLPGQRAHTTAGDVFELLLGACRVMPEIYDQEIVESWSAFRPISSDDRPMIGKSVVRNLWLATGHSRFGYLMAPFTAELLADGILNGTVHKRFGALRPQRMLRVS